MKHSNETVTNRTAYERLCVRCDEQGRNTSRRLRGLDPGTEEEVAASVEQRMRSPEQLDEIDEGLRATAQRLMRKTLGPV
ncbi:MAG: hypothetical protein WC840_01500 [Candidatus Peribacteraceae bacterium]